MLYKIKYFIPFNVIIHLYYYLLKSLTIFCPDSCMYISGVPGTGKTATVKEVVKTLEAERDEGNLQNFKFVEVNGMRVTEPRQAYVEILKVG